MKHIGQALAFGILFATILVGGFCLLRFIFYVPLKRKMWLQDAVDNGRAATARLKKKPLGWSMGYRLDHWRWERFQYEFQYDGKRYVVRVNLKDIAYDFPPEELLVYWRKRPSKACEAGLIGNTEGKWKLPWLILTMLFTAVAL